LSWQTKEMIRKKSSSKDSQGLELKYFACGIVYLTSTKIVQIVALGGIDFHLYI
jgi:hypothetical protein